MKIEKISYQVTIPVQSFVYDKIGVEASVDSDSEDISECFNQLKKNGRWVMQASVSAFICSAKNLRCSS